MTKYDIRALLVIAVIMVATFLLLLFAVDWAWHEDVLAMLIVGGLCWWGYLVYEKSVF